MCGCAIDTLICAADTSHGTNIIRLCEDDKEVYPATPVPSYRRRVGAPYTRRRNITSAYPLLDQFVQVWLSKACCLGLGW